ncbi:TPA: hypothetical protein EYO12_00565 [Candidatus Saccharibacteria bacterium]|nr:hypothetical protein [Candidatus Saccharibacteria bacterium]HIO87588.1 hypothetical protein [Candidatus Saccharibacteria bacterium]
MDYNSDYLRRSCTDLFEGLIFGDEVMVSSNSNALVDAGLPLAEYTGIEEESFDEDHFRFAILCAASSKLISDWSYFRFVANSQGFSDDWLRFLKRPEHYLVDNTDLDDKQIQEITDYIKDTFREQFPDQHNRSIEALKRFGRSISSIFEKTSAE